MVDVAKDAPDGARNDAQSPYQEIPPSPAQSPVKDSGKDYSGGSEAKDAEGANEAEATIASTPDFWLSMPAHKYRAVHYLEPGLIFPAKVLHHRRLPGFRAPRLSSSGFSGIVVHRFQIRGGVMCYIDILLINPAYHDEFFKINFTTRGGVYFAHHSVGADFLYDAVVLLVKGLDKRVDPVAVADRIKKKFRKRVDFSVVWGVHSAQSPPEEASRLQFEGSLYLVGKARPYISDTESGWRPIKDPPFVDLKGIEHAGNNHSVRCITQPLWSGHANGWDYVYEPTRDD
ncbi:uncharacterized protein PSANT_04207 [Moesziomyces antarcticus]|uniref:Uncharacterized protein n=1 Tax=Pseudozyma antarctica TaxID=84753 RepID=A0A5C3FSP9_PSEA2|nr:uncharacterized protein PSANT_04207 [Moesziomyces antarcticus]